jgi:hypothetical protein
MITPILTELTRCSYLSAVETEETEMVEITEIADMCERDSGGRLIIQNMLKGDIGVEATLLF